jgi:hypothetical protein
MVMDLSVGDVIIVVWSMIGLCAEPVWSISCFLRFVKTTNRYLNGLI